MKNDNININHEDGRLLQSEIFESYNGCDGKHFFKITKGKTLNQFLRDEKIIEIHKVIKLDKYRLLIFYYTIPELCGICGKYKEECEGHNEKEEV